MNRLVSSAFIGLPCPRNAAGMRGFFWCGICEVYATPGPSPTETELPDCEVAAPQSLHREFPHRSFGLSPTELSTRTSKKTRVVEKFEGPFN